MSCLLWNLENLLNSIIPYAYNRKLSAYEFEKFIDIWHILAEQVPRMPPQLVILMHCHVEIIMYLEKRESMKQLDLLWIFRMRCLGLRFINLVLILEDTHLKISRNEAL